MAYREPAAAPPPRRLVVRPQRAFGSLAFAAFGVAFVCATLHAAVKAVVEEGVSAAPLVFLATAAFAAIFLVVGLHGWLLRVELSLSDDDALTMRWTRWPFAPRTHVVAPGDVLDVIVDEDDGMQPIVVVTRGERVPLTGT